jgi:hypothetical protein
MATSPVLSALKKASSGLLYPSESDEPFKAFSWPRQKGERAAQAVLRAGKHDPDSPVEEVPVEEFFNSVIEEWEAQGEEGQADAQRYRELLRVLREQLTDLKVFRIGQIQVAIYLIGKTRDGAWAGVRTTSIET